MGPLKTVKQRTKYLPTEWEKIFINPISDRDLISKINKELKKLVTKRKRNLIQKWSTDLNRELLAEGSKMAEIYGNAQHP